MSSSVSSSLTKSSPTLTFVVLAVSAASFSMLQSLLNPALPIIQRDLQTTQSTVTWVLTAWLLSASVATPLLGRIGDMIGKKRTLMVALAAIALGSLVCALAPTIGLLLLGRVIQGLGGAIFPLSFGIIRDEFPAARVPSAVGILSAVIAVGGGLGTVLAGPIVDGLGWRWLFWVPLIVVIVTGLVTLRFVPESPVRAGGRINWLAALLLAGWLVALLLPLSQGTAWGWTSPATQGLFVVSAVLLVLWIVVEARSSNPVIDMRMMRLPSVWTTNLVAFLFGAGMFAVLAFVPQFVQTPASAGYGFGASVTVAGLLVLPLTVMMAVTGFLSGPLSPIVSFRAQLAWGSALSAVASAGFAFFHAEPWQIAAAGGVFGLGLGLAYASMTSLIVQSVPAGQTGAASGMNANIRTIGGAIGTAVVSSVVTSSLQPSGLPYESGFSNGFIVLTVTAVLAVIVSFLVPKTRRSDKAGRADAVAEPVGSEPVDSEPVGAESL